MNRIPSTNTYELPECLTQPRQCFCVGPQNGDPCCPCRMQNISVKDGRYVEIIDHGPAPEKPLINGEIDRWDYLEESA